MKELVDKRFSKHNLTSEAQMIIEDNLPCLCGSAHCYNLAEPQPQEGERFALINTCTLPEASYQNNENKSEVITSPLTSPGYCSISSRHSLCLYSPQQHAANTCGKVYSLGVGETEKMELLDVHNELRVKVAGGKEMGGSPTGHQPPAADMMMLEWDEELAAVAQAWVNQCVFKHDCNRCRSLGRWSVGQNLYLSGGLRAEGQDWRRALTSFYDEVTMMNPSQVQALSGSGGVGHYTHLVWAATRFVGCGFIQYQSSGYTQSFYACNYGSAGNVVGRPIYQQGPGCSRCPTNTSCSTHYPSLCTAHHQHSDTGGDSEEGGPGGYREGGGDDESEGGGDESSIDSCPKYSKCQEVYKRLADNEGIFVVLHCP